MNYNMVVFLTLILFLVFVYGGLNTAEKGFQQLAGLEVEPMAFSIYIGNDNSDQKKMLVIFFGGENLQYSLKSLQCSVLFPGQFTSFMSRSVSLNIKQK